ncbi:hypothetical protein Tco_0623112 [Tanacetum coccineum]
MLGTWNKSTILRNLGCFQAFHCDAIMGQMLCQFQGNQRDYFSNDTFRGVLHSASSSSEYSWSESRLKSGDLNSSRLRVLKCLLDDRNSRSVGFVLKIEKNLARKSNRKTKISVSDDRYAVSNGSGYADKNVNATRPKVVVNVARPKAVVNAVKGNNFNVVKASACWAKTVNGEVQLQALVDGKKIIITESTVRRDLQLEDADGDSFPPSGNSYSILFYICLSSKICHGYDMKCFDVSKGRNRCFLGREHHYSKQKVVQRTSRKGCRLQQILLMSPSTPTIIQPSTSQPQKKQRPRNPKRKDTQIPQSSFPSDNVADEVVNEDMDDSLVRADTTTTSLDAEQDREGESRKLATRNIHELMDLKIIQKLVHLRRADEDMFGVNNLDDDEVIIESVDIVILLEANKKVVARSTVSYKFSLCAITTTTTTAITNVEITLAQALTELKSEKPRAVKVVIQEPEQGTTTTTLTTTTAATTIIVDSTRPKAKWIVFHEQEQAPTPTVSSQQPSQVKNLTSSLAEEDMRKACREKKLIWEAPKSFIEQVLAEIIQELFDKAMKRVNTFVDYRTELVEESSKKAETELVEEKDKESEELKQCLEIVPDDGDDVTIDATPLSTKSSTIVDYKIYKENKKSYFQIIRADDMFGVNDLEGDEVLVESEGVVKTDEERINMVEEVADIISAATTVTLAELKSARPPTQGISFRELSETTTTTTTTTIIAAPKPPRDKGKAKEEEEERLAREKSQQVEEANIPWDDVQAKIEAGYQLAQRLQAQEQEELIDEEKARLFVQFLEQRRKYFAAKRAEEKRNRPPTRAQQRSIMCTYLKSMEGWKPKSLKNKTELVEESSKKEEAKIAHESSLQRAGEELEQESSKKQKLEEDKESEELKKCLEIVPDDGDDVTIDATPLSTKSPTIVDYKIYKEGKKSYFQIFRVDGNSQMYLTFGKMLKNFDIEELETMFEHHVEDNVWKNQQELVRVLSWKLYDSCGVHCVTMQSMIFYLLVEKMYLLTNYTLYQMFNEVKLQVDYECKMAFELLRLVKKQLKEGYERIVGIKSFLEVTAAKVCVTVAKLNTTSVKLVLLVKIEENILSSYYCLYTVNAASAKVTTAQRLRLLKEFLLSEENG